MSIKLPVSLALCAALLATPLPAAAQFGGMMKKVPGLGGGGSSAPSADVGPFLDNALQSTKNVMIASAVLNAVLSSNNDINTLKARVGAVQNAHDMKELGAHKAELQSDMEAIGRTRDMGEQDLARYQTLSAERKKLVTVAVGNLAIGMLRNVHLAQQAPGMVSSLSGNPQMLRRLGEVKAAADLVGVQAKGLSSISGALPKVMGAMKLKMPSPAETSQPQSITL